MRKTFFAIATFAVLAGCNTTGGGAVPISNVQKEAVAICGYLPIAKVVSAILAKGSLTSVFAIATSICHAVTIQGGAGGPNARGLNAPVPKVDGVVIRGRFVR